MPHPRRSRAKKAKQPAKQKTVVTIRVVNQTVSPKFIEDMRRAGVDSEIIDAAEKRNRVLAASGNR